MGKIPEAYIIEDAPQALLAGDDDLGVLGDLGLHLAQELLVGDHVAAAQPPATQPKIGGLLQQVDDAPLCLGNVDGDLHSTLHSCLQSEARDILLLVGHSLTLCKERKATGLGSKVREEDVIYLGNLSRRSHVQEHPALLCPTRSQLKRVLIQPCVESYRGQES